MNLPRIRSRGPTVARTRQGRLRCRLAVLGVLAALSSAVVLATPAPASAAPVTPDRCTSGCVPCPSGVTWHVWFKFGSIRFYEGFQYTIVSATPTFFASDARQVANNLDTDITVTLTSQKSRTFSITTTVGFARELTQQLTINVSTQIVESRTTAIGVNVQATVPPHRSILGEYGVHGYSVVYNVRRWLADNESLPQGICSGGAAQNGLTASAPTFVEGWRISLI